MSTLTANICTYYIHIRHLKKPDCYCIRSLRLPDLYNIFVSMIMPVMFTHLPRIFALHLTCDTCDTGGFRYMFW